MEQDMVTMVPFVHTCLSTRFKSKPGRRQGHEPEQCGGLVKGLSESIKFAPERPSQLLLILCLAVIPQSVVVSTSQPVQESMLVAIPLTHCPLLFLQTDQQSCAKNAPNSE
jgi:hypothetical protein